MSAHSRPITTQCFQFGCTKLATEEVFNTFNAAQGNFCKAHAKTRVAELLEGERVLRAAERGDG